MLPCEKEENEDSARSFSDYPCSDVACLKSVMNVGDKWRGSN